MLYCLHIFNPNPYRVDSFSVEYLLLHNLL